MNRRIFSVIISVLLIILCAAPAFASAPAADYTFTIKVSDNTVKTGEKITVSLEIADNSGDNLEIYTMQDYVGYDPECFKAVEGSLDVTTGFNATFQNGRVYVNRYSTQPLADIETSTLTVMTFELEAINPGQVELDHSVVEMVGERLVFFTVDLVNATVTVEEAENYEPVVPDVPVIRYDIDYPSRISHGDIEVSHSTAKRGTTVKITVYPDDGYELENLVVVRGNGRTLTLTKRGTDTYAFTMPAGDVEILVSFVKIGEETTDTTAPDTPPVDPDVPPVHVCPSAAFTDVDQTQWYHDAIDYVTENGLMNGMSADTFAPGVTTSRAMIATILWRQQGQPTVDTEMPFSDVAEGQWYTEAIRWAAANGIINGYGADIFGPNDTITREQFATMLFRYEKAYKDSTADATGFVLDFTDADKVSDWALDAMLWCNKHGIINGMGGGILLPQGNATRAQAAQILMNYNTKQ